jgi:hypothetical protein
MHHRSCVFMTDIYLTISLSTHNGDETSEVSALRSKVGERKLANKRFRLNTASLSLEQK